MYSNILLPIDFDHEEGNQKAFSVARLLADENAEFTVMHVIETIPGYVRGQISDETLVERRKEMQQSLEAVAASLKGAKAELVIGHSGQTIVNFADANSVDCIVLASHKPNVSDFFIGSTASRVVHHANCAVHVVR